jgi:hypothetical protein
MSKYFYKGSDISNLIELGSTKVSGTGYTDFPSYTPASIYSTERPFPFNYYTAEQGQLSDLMNTKFVEFTSGQSGTYTIPSDYDSVKIILIGGGGGGGGGGGCAWLGLSIDSPSKARSSGAAGISGNHGSYMFTSNYINLTSKNIYYSVGTKGNSGVGGGDKSTANMGSGGKGNNGYHGNESMVTINVGGIDYNIYANGGEGGGGGDGGDSVGTGDPPDPAPAFNNNFTGLVNYSSGIPSAVNPINYLNNIGLKGNMGQESTANQYSGNGNDGGPGKIRIYFYKP